METWSLTVSQMIDSEGDGNNGCNYGSAVSQAGSLIVRAHTDVLFGIHLFLGRFGVLRPKHVAFIFVEALLVVVFVRAQTRYRVQRDKSGAFSCPLRSFR